MPAQAARPHQRTSSYPQRPSSLSSESSVSSQVTTISSTRPPPHIYQNGQASASATSLATASARGPHLRPPGSDAVPMRQPSPLATPPIQADRRRHPQGFFEPSLPTASYGGNNLDASQIAARAAMHLQGPRQDLKRAQTIPEPPLQNRRKGSGPPPIQTASSSASSSRTNSLVDDKLAATTAANAAYPRSPSFFPSLQQGERSTSPATKEESKPGKERSRMKLFHKPKAIQTSRSSDKQAVSSPKGGIYGAGSVANKLNQSTTSLADSIMSGASSLYLSGNASTSTLVPADKQHGGERERHRHHFLSRQKHKEHNLPLSSASSTSRPTDPAAPQPLYSFAPSSPGPGSKSFSGLDLRHGGRALREKKKEEKAAAANNFVPPVASADSTHAGQGFDWTGSASTPAVLTPGAASELGIITQGLGGFGLPGMSVDDAWPLLKARLLNIFEGEDLRTPVEDFNRLVTAHLQRCIARRTPHTIVEDLRELLYTGFMSLEMTLRGVSDERLVPHLVDMWASVFGIILPFMQAVFLPLDLEFHGRGPLLSSRDAAEFWAPAVASMSASTANPSTTLDVRTQVLATFRNVVILPRHDTLLASFSRLSLDNINAPPLVPLSPPQLVSALRPGTAGSSSGGVDPAMASYTSNNSTLLETTSSLGSRSRATSNTSAGSFHSINSTRPRHGTVGTGAPPTLMARGGYLHDTAPGPDSPQITQTAARMLQCVSVLAGLQVTPRPSDSRDSNSSTTSTFQAGSFSSVSTSSNSFEGPRRARAATMPVGSTTAAADFSAAEEREQAARRKMERLAKELKLNWLGRGRTGRNRRGFVGSKVRPGVGIGVGA